MKKVNIIILSLVVIVFALGVYKLFLNDISEEFELLNKDVSLNNIKSVMEVELQENENIEQIPLGYKDDEIYILKYTYEDIENKVGKYDEKIYKIDESGNVLDSEFNIPEEYCRSNNLNVYGNYIFCGNSYYNWTTGEKTTIFTDTDEYKSAPVSGNKDYILYEKTQNEENKYYLVNIKNKSIYEYKVSINSNDKLKDVFFDKDTSEFYGIDYSDHIVRLNLSGGSFSTEVYDNDVNFEHSNDEKDNYSIGNRYICIDNGKVYVEQSKLKNIDGSISRNFDINRYYLTDKYIEHIDSIDVLGYDKYNSDCLVVKRKDDAFEKMYFAKFKNSNMDILMEIPRVYGNESDILINMSDGANLLVKETYYDSSNKKINNKYLIYDLKEYFNNNEYVLNNDGTWIGKENDTASLKNVYKNIDESQKENKEPPVINKTDDIPKVNVNENIQTSNKNTNEVSEKKVDKPEETDDFREHDSSWRKGNGDWYYYDNRDKKVTSGWIRQNNKWYYFDENGVMQKNAIVLEHGCEFNLDENGVLVDSDTNNEKYLKDKSKENIYEDKNQSKDNKKDSKSAKSEENEKSDNEKEKDKSTNDKDDENVNLTGHAE